MDTLLANAYGTSALVADEMEKTAEAQLLEELEKVAAAEGIDLDTLSDDDIIEILQEAMGVEAEETVEAEKTASDDSYEDGQIKLSEDEFLAADYKGRVIAHAIINELASVGNHMEKEASADEGNAIVDRANEILEMAVEAAEGQEKQASDEAADIDTAALQLLAENGYDTDLIVDLLS